ncbi:MAG: hypothetical protein VW362_03830 [Candidatus Nanopelagicales bacterium]
MDEPFSDPARFPDVARIDALLAGIVAESGAAADAADDEEIFELERAGRAGVHLLDRLATADLVRVEIAGGELVAGRVVAIGRDVVIVAEDGGDWAIPLWGITAVTTWPGTSAWAVAALDRLGILAVARSWARERDVVRVHRVGAIPLDGTIDAVGADHLELAEHDPGEPRRADAVRRIVTVPVGAIAALRRR